MATNSQVGKARVDNQRVLTTKPLEDLVQDRSNQVTDLIEAQKRYNSLVKPI
jgi:flagellar hook protein FlgE